MNFYLFSHYKYQKKEQNYTLISQIEETKEPKRSVKMPLVIRIRFLNFCLCEIPTAFYYYYYYSMGRTVLKS